MKEKKCSQVDERTERCRQFRSAGILQSDNTESYAHNNGFFFFRSSGVPRIEKSSRSPAVGNEKQQIVQANEIMFYFT